MDPFKRLCRSLKADEYVELRFIDAGSKVRQHFCTSLEEAQQAIAKAPTNTHIYYGAAPRSEKQGKDESVKRLCSLWADLDCPNEAATEDDIRTLIKSVVKIPLPPTYMVNTGGGLHLYWWLEEPIELDEQKLESAKATMVSLAKFLKGDSVQNPGRVLRVPGTLNLKYTPPREAKVLSAYSKVVYPFEDLVLLPQLFGMRGLDRIQSGDCATYKSRSELDFIIMRSMLRVGVSDSTIRVLFDSFPIGKKVRQAPPDGGEYYFTHTLENARESAAAVKKKGKQQAEQAPIEAREDGYWRGEARLSSFTLSPKVIVTIEGSAEDILICDVHAQGTAFVWKDIPFPRRAFDDKRSLQRLALTKASWMWYGSDKDAQLVLAKLMEDLQEQGIPLRVMTQTLGVARGTTGEEVWVGTNQTLSSEFVYEGDDAPISYLPPKHETPVVHYSFGEDSEYKIFLNRLYELLPRANRPEVMGCLIGWLFATPFKTHFEQLGVRFPILSLYGTRGSGKTSTIQKIVLPLLSVISPKLYSCATTQFVLLSLFGSTNSIPIAFHEFRRSTFSDPELARFTRLLLQAYNVGIDYRGRSDQSTRAYPLLAPCIIDGEDVLNDPALKERIIPIAMHPADVEVRSEHSEVFKKLSELPLTLFAGRYVQHCLGHPLTRTGWDEVLARVDELTPTLRADRIRNNLGVVAFGLRLFEEFGKKWGVASSELVGAAVQGALNAAPIEVRNNLMRESATQVVTELLFEAAGRTPVLVDGFLTDLINYVDTRDGAKSGFTYKYDRETNILYFHLTTSVQWWNQVKARRRESPTDITTIRTQLAEVDVSRGGYAVGGETMNVRGKSVRLYGVDILKAQALGLDIPDRINPSEIVIKMEN